MPSIRLASRLAAVSAAAALALPAAAYAVPSPGAPGAGDPYFPKYGNGGYDVRHYDIHVSYNLGTHRLRGNTEVRARATQDLSRFNLDLMLRAKKVTVDGVEATFVQGTRELLVTPAAPIPTGSTFRVRVRYAGFPAKVTNANLGGWYLTGDGAVATGEPEVATAWYPSNDHPSDKARFDIYVTTRGTKQVISNGVLRGVTSLGSRKRWHWKVAEPMATYLATAVIGDYRISRGRTRNGVRWLNAVTTHLPKGRRRAAVLSLRRTPAIVDFYTRSFGSYPFSRAGGIIANASIPFSLESQTRPVYSPIFFGSGRSGVNTTVIAHELAHMWWGDSVSLARWRDIWLNEGFATWSSWLWLRHERGVSLNRTFQSFYSSYRGNPGFWNLSVDDPGARNIFDAAVYDRGAMAMQALRNLIGASAHERLLRRWAQTEKYGNASVSDFETLAAEVSGQDLTTFFDEWLHQTDLPLPSAALGFPSSMLGRGTAPRPLPGDLAQSLRRRM